MQLQYITLAGWFNSLQLIVHSLSKCSFIKGADLRGHEYCNCIAESTCSLIEGVTGDWQEGALVDWLGEPLITQGMMHLFWRLNRLKKAMPSSLPWTNGCKATRACKWIDFGSEVLQQAENATHWYNFSVCDPLYVQNLLKYSNNAEVKNEIFCKGIKTAGWTERKFSVAGFLCYSNNKLTGHIKTRCNWKTADHLTIWTAEHTFIQFSVVGLAAPQSRLQDAHFVFKPLGFFKYVRTLKCIQPAGQDHPQRLSRLKIAKLYLFFSNLAHVKDWRLSLKPLKIY